MAGLLTAAYHPHDLAYRQKREQIINHDMRHWSAIDVEKSFLNACAQERPEGTETMTRRIFSELAATKLPGLAKSILDTTGGGTSGGSVLIRQDLEPSAR